MIWLLGFALIPLGLLLFLFFLLLYYSLLKIYGHPTPGPDHIYIGRWVSLVHYLYVEECYSCDVRPYVDRVENELADGTLVAQQPSIDNEAPLLQATANSRRHKSFITAALATRDKLMLETSTLV